MDNQQKIDLLTKLLNGIASKRHKWVVGGIVNGGGEVYSLSFTKSSLLLIDKSVQDSDDPYIIHFMNSEGKSVETLRIQSFPKEVNAKGALQKVIAHIKDQTYGISDTINDVFENL